MIPDDMVEEVRARADIVEIVGEVVELKKAGRDYKGRCPFHDDKTPSFHVIPAKGFYHCFGCGESGDAFTFMMKRQGLSFVDAVKVVAAKSGIQVREVRGREAEEDPNRPLHEANAFARDFFYKELRAESGVLAREYLEGRGISLETAERFGIGYAPDAWRTLREAAERHGIDDEVLLEVGLLTRSDRMPDPYDRFRDRIIFPIEDTSGKVVAFGGRVLGSGGAGQPKYVNSPESPVYHKGQILYGLSRAKNEIRRAETAIVAEGYMDVVSLAAAGVENAVAPLGTALTDAQARLLKRYTTRVLLLFDSDAPGVRASFKAGEVLLAEGLHPAVVTLPPGEDPDSLIRTQGLAALRQALDGATDVLDRKIQILEERDYFGSVERTRRALDKLLPTVRAVADPALRDIYVQRVSERTGVRRETIETELKRPGGAVGGSRPPQQSEPPVRRAARIPKMGAERALLVVLMKSRDWIERAAERADPSDFADAVYRRIFEMLIEDPDLDRVLPDVDPQIARRLEELLGATDQLDHIGRIFDESIAHIRGAAMDREIIALDRQIDEAPDDGTRLELITLKQKLRRERRDVGADWRTTARKLRPGGRALDGLNPHDEARG